MTWCASNATTYETHRDQGNPKFQPCVIVKSKFGASYLQLWGLWQNWVVSLSPCFLLVCCWRNLWTKWKRRTCPRPQSPHHQSSYLHKRGATLSHIFFSQFHYLQSICEQRYIKMSCIQMLNYRIYLWPNLFHQECLKMCIFYAHINK